MWISSCQLVNTGSNLTILLGGIKKELKWNKIESYSKESFEKWLFRSENSLDIYLNQ